MSGITLTEYSKFSDEEKAAHLKISLHEFKSNYASVLRSAKGYQHGRFLGRGYCDAAVYYNCMKRHMDYGSPCGCCCPTTPYVEEAFTLLFRDLTKETCLKMTKDPNKSEQYRSNVTSAYEKVFGVECTQGEKSTFKKLSDRLKSGSLRGVAES